MKQLGTDLNLATKRTRNCELLDQMERVVPFAALVQVVEPYYPRAKTGRPHFGIETMHLECWQLAAGGASGVSAQ